MKASSSLMRIIPQLALLCCATTLHAGPLPPCVRATLSANAQILVLNELTFDSPDETIPRRIQTSTFRVLQRRTELNEHLRLNGPNTYWSDPIWSVSFDDSQKSPFASCPYTLVTGDAEFLILLSERGDRIALRIYRRRDHPGQPFGGPGPDHGVLIREVPLSALWPPERIPTIFTDHSPEWFAFGTLAFSQDDRLLIYKTQWGTTLKINLADGAVAAL